MSARGSKEEENDQQRNLFSAWLHKSSRNLIDITVPANISPHMVHEQHQTLIHRGERSPCSPFALMRFDLQPHFFFMASLSPHACIQSAGRCASYLWAGERVCILSRWCTLPCRGEVRAGASPPRSSAGIGGPGCTSRCKRRTPGPRTRRTLGSSRSPAP